MEKLAKANKTHIAMRTLQRKQINRKIRSLIKAKNHKLSQGYLYTQNAGDLFEPILHSEVVADDLVIYYIV